MIAWEAHVKSAAVTPRPVVTCFYMAICTVQVIGMHIETRIGM